MLSSLRGSARLLPALVMLVTGAAANADTVFVSLDTQARVLRYDLSGVADTGTQLADITNLDEPVDLHLRDDELFVVLQSSSGSPGVARFLDADGAATPNGIITQPGLSNPFGITYSETRDEMFVSSRGEDRIHRFTFDGAGNANTSTTFAAGLGSGTNGVRNLVFDADESHLYVSETANVEHLNQLTMAPGAGGAVAPTAASPFPAAGVTGPHGMVFTPWGELLVAAFGEDRIRRFTFDGSNNPIANGFINGLTLDNPVDIVFTSWGEMIVSNYGSGVLSRFTFDASRAAIEGTAIDTGYASVNSLALLQDAIVPEPTSTALLALGCVLAAVGRRSRRSPR